MKFIGLLLSLLLLVGCSTKDDYYFVKDDLTKIYSVPYIEVDKTNVDKMDAAIDTLSERFKDDFSEDTLMKHIAIQTFIYLNDVDENIIIDDIEVKKTADYQYSFTVKMSSDTNKYESSGSIRYEDEKIVYFEIGQYPSYIKK